MLCFFNIPLLQYSNQNLLISFPLSGTQSRASVQKGHVETGISVTVVSFSLTCLIVHYNNKLQEILGPSDTKRLEASYLKHVRYAQPSVFIKE